MKKGLPFAGAFLAVVLAGPSASRASDHIDGLKTAIDNAADLTDLYTFTSPQDDTKLVMVMNVHGIAYSGSQFSNAVDYKFRIRQVPDPKTLAPVADPRMEAVITCNFSGGITIIDSKQHATCRFEVGGQSDVVAFDTRGADGVRAGGMGGHDDLRVFAGVRSDTWFLDLGKTLAYNASLPVPQGAGVNGLHGQNVLSIVVELDKRRLGGPLLAITAQTVRK